MTQTETTTRRPATIAEIAATAGRPAHRQVVEVETNTDGRATIGRAKTVHRATVVTSRNVHGESIGRIATVDCGSRRYRNTGGKGDTVTVVSARYDIDCEKCQH